MAEITSMPVPSGRWAMMFTCGATEIRAEDGPKWAAFHLEKIDSSHYRIICRDCGHFMEQNSTQAEMGSAVSSSKCNAIEGCSVRRRIS